MNKFFTLLKVTVNDIFLSDAGSTKKNKKRVSAGTGFQICMMMLVGLLLAFNAYTLGQESMDINTYPFLISIGMAYSCVIILMLGVFKVPTYLYAFKDYDRLMSLPFTSAQILASKLAALYISNFIYAAAFTTGYLISCGVLMGAGAGYYIMSVVSLLFIPMFPTVIGAVLGIILGWITKATGNSRVVKIVSSVVMMVAVMFVAFTIGFSPSMDADALASVYGIADKINFPALLIKRALVGGDVLSFILFIAAETAMFIAFCLIFSGSFKKINAAMSCKGKGKKFEMTELKTSSRFAAVYKKELSGYFSNTNYFLNTAMGYIMLLIFAVAAMFVDIKGFTEHIGIYPECILLVIFLFCEMMSSITSPSVSLDAPYLWIYMSSPLSAKDIVKAKLLMALTITLPSTIVACAVISFAVGLAPLKAVALICAAAASGVFAQVFGMWLSLKMPKLDWTNEITVIKQSGAVAIAVLGGMAISLVTGVPAVVLGLIFPEYSYVVIFAIFILYALFCAVFYAIINKTCVKRFNNLYG